MPANYGASPEAWAHWSTALGLVEDLLPVVSNPHAEVSPDSTMEMTGKTPSEYNFRRQVKGLPKWTQRHSNKRDVERWLLEPDYGICLQTRDVRALDIDVTNPRLAKRITDWLEREFPWHIFPKRTRSDSGKCLLLFRGPLETKRVIPVEGGMIEWLSTGQQCIIEGTHPGGQRYLWPDGLPAAIPELDADDFEALWSGLCAEFGTGEPRIARTKRTLDADSIPDTDDEVAEWLIGNWTVYDSDAEGRLFVECPFAAEHTTDTGITSTWYAPAGTAGYERGHWNCLHAHCEGRTDQDFNIKTGYNASLFDDIAEPSPRDLEIAEDPAPWPRLTRDAQGKIEASARNMVAVTERADICGMMIAYDGFLDAIIWSKPPAQGEKPRWQEFKDEHYIDLRIELEKRGFKAFGKEMLRDVVARVARYRRVDIATEWLSRLKWDGVPRVDQFMHRYLGCEDNAYNAAVGAYAWTAHAGRVLQPGCQADMAIVLIGQQGARKTSAIKALVPDKAMYTTINMQDRDDNLSRQLRGKLVGELEELRGLNSREAEEIKAWVTKTHEEWVPKFKEFGTQFPRRLLFWGSGNAEGFLGDPTGERRYLPTYVGEAIDVEGIQRDREQLWAEGAERFAAGGIEWAMAEMLAKAEHHKFKVSDAWDGPVAHWLVTERLDGTKPEDAPFAIHEALTEAVNIPIQNHDRGKEMRMSAILKSYGFARKQVGTDRAWRYLR